MSTTPTTGVPPITEDDIANYLLQTPDFFNRHAELLATVQLSSPHGGRAVSLQERQAEMLRERIKGLERRVMDMIRHGNENMVLAERLMALARTLLLVRLPAELPARLLEALHDRFQVPQAALKVWGVADAYAGEPWAQGVSGDLRSFASSLTQPYVGANAGFEAVRALAEPERVASVALIALRESADAPAFGLLVLGSPDPQRFAAGMGTDLLERLGELASAALARLR